MTTPQIIAHRGASYLAPENTLVAFRKAMEIGADGVEMDVQKTYDNELVIHHDYMVDMHTDISGQIYDLTMGELKVGALTYGAFLSMVLPPPVVWKDLGLVNSMDEPFSEENCIDLRNNLIYRTVADKVDMLRANFPGETVEQVIGHLEEQADVATYIKTLDFPVDIVSCEYHTAYSNPELVNQLHAMGIQAAFWTVDTQDAVRSLLPLGPDCIVTNRPDRVREWVNAEMRK